MGLSLDDFGTGFSSLRYLQRFPVRSIKLDRSYSQELESSPRQRQLVRAVAHLSHALGLLVVAEGVENDRQRQILESLDCDLGQGHGISRPMPASALVDYLAHRRIAQAPGAGELSRT